MPSVRERRGDLRRGERSESPQVNFADVQEGQEGGDIYDDARDETTGNDDIEISESEGVIRSVEAAMSLKFSSASSKNTKWWRGYVLLNIEDGGSLVVYPDKPKKKESEYVGGFALRRRMLQKATTRHSTRIGVGKLSFVEDIEPILEIPPHINWMGKDFENSAKRFILEIPTDNTILPSAIEAVQEEAQFFEDISDDDDDDGDHSSFDRESFIEDALAIPPKLQEYLENAKSKGEPFRLHLEVLRKGQEKGLWLKAFTAMNRFSFEVHQRSLITRIVKNPQLKTSRIRGAESDRFTAQTKVLEQDLSTKAFDDDILEPAEAEGSYNTDYRIQKKNDNREYLVYPPYSYPNQWMTDSEIHAEMIKPSICFHDLRVTTEKQKEIGVARVEVLNCAGLPALDFASKTDAVCYLVCGSYAFTTDVIQDKLNPAWLPRTRRACIFPLFHAYAQIYIGVFDDDGKGQNDDFAGRVVLDLARCRPGSTYDVALPLRLSSHIYTRRKRGVIRLRFSIEYNSEREAILSYIPRNLRGITEKRPNDDVTVVCSDEKAFRNIAQTVHGNHMPGRFSMSYMQGTVKEFQFTLKLVLNTIEETVLEIVFWKNPFLSSFIFISWMTSVYMNSISLVPFQIVTFCFLIMIRNYVFYGSDGRLQQGFIPPSIEEMLAALLGLHRRNSPAIKPLFVRPHKDERSNLVRGETFETHGQLGKPLFDLVGFKSVTVDDYPEDYHMELPYSRGLTHPILRDDYQYPRFSVKEAMVPKSGKTKGSEKGESKDDILLSDVMGTFSATGSSKRDVATVSKTSMLGSRRGGFKATGVVGSMANLSKGVAGGIKDLSKSAVGGMSQVAESIASSNPLTKVEGCLREEYQALPGDLKIPMQNIDAKSKVEKDNKNLLDDFNELRNDVHKLSFHLFNDKAYTVAPGAVYFGRGVAGNKKNHVSWELDRLLGCGQHTSANPVIKYAGAYLEPLIKSLHGVISIFRVVYFLLTWRDPFLSFLATLGLACLAFILAIFPFRLFFLVGGIAVVGPQNWIISRCFMKTDIIEHFREKKIEKKKKKMAKVKENSENMMLPSKVIPEDQPIISGHSSNNNTAPTTLSIADVDKRELHQVCVPYTQLKFNRDYHWPPDPEYAKCDPHIKQQQIPLPPPGTPGSLKKLWSDRSISSKGSNRSNSWKGSNSRSNSLKGSMPTLPKLD